MKKEKEESRNLKSNLKKLQNMSILKRLDLIVLIKHSLDRVDKKKYYT